MHILDYCRAVIELINADISKVKNEIFNVGHQNLKIKDIAIIVKEIVEKKFFDKDQIEIVTTESDDKRSYHINSDKIKNILNFEPIFSVENAVEDLCDAFKKNLIPNSFDNINYFNVAKLKSINAK